MDGNIVLDCWVNTPESSFFKKPVMKRAQSATAPSEKNINNLEVELGHSFESITHATTEALGNQVTGTFMSC